MSNNIGKTLYVAEALPATNDAAGFAALTWVKVNGVQSIGGIGITHAGIDIDDLQTGFTRQVKGAGAGTDSSMTFRNIAADAGQLDVKGLAENKAGLGSIKIVKGSGTAEAPATGDPVRYAQGFFHSYLPNDDNVTSYDGWSVTFRNNAAAVDATQPAP
jgi:hypothetical protein